MKAIRYILTALVFLLYACNSEKPEYSKLQGEALGTQFHITYKSPVDLSNAIDSLFGEINSVLSTYHEHSLISRFNRSGYGMNITHPYFIEVFKKAKNIYHKTDGYFDPTIGTLVNAWQFGAEKSGPLPDSAKVKELLQTVGFDKMHFEGDSLVKLPGMYLDFNAIAKGYAVDVLGRFLEKKGIDNYMVEIGGEIRVRGLNPAHKLWVIGIEKPVTGNDRVLDISLPLTGKSIATSGNYRKFRIDEKGRKYVHTINPKTGYPEINNLLSASVITRGDCADADAYATALMVMGYPKAKEFVFDNKGMSAVLIYSDEDDKIITEKIN